MISLEEYKKRHVTVVVEEQHANGLQVIEGPRGERGEKGDKGDPGESNIPGPQGEPGKDGQNGKDGEQGPAGKDGIDGKDGAPGKDGLPGVDGKDGKDGLPGRDGVDGKDGIDGKDGAPGAPGIPGTAGKDGAPGATGPKGDTGAAGVGIKGFASGYVNAGQFVTLDNLKFSVTTGGSRGLCCATVSGTVVLSISASYASASVGATGAATYWPGATYTPTPSGSWFGWSFPNAGDASTYLINDYNNQRFYRVHLQIGPSYNNNFISIERLY